MNDLAVAQLWAVVLGLVTPLIVAVVKRPGMSKQSVQIVSLAAAVIIGVINLVVQGLLNNIEYNATTVMTLIVAVIGASQAAYVSLWKPTGVEPAIDKVTSPVVPE